MVPGAQPAHVAALLQQSRESLKPAQRRRKRCVRSAAIRKRQRGIGAHTDCGARRLRLDLLSHAARAPEARAARKCHTRRF